MLRAQSNYLGLNEQRFPRDFASLINYYTEIQKVPARYPLPGPLSLSQLDRFLSEHGHHFQVEWLDGSTEQEQAAD